MAGILTIQKCNEAAALSEQKKSNKQIAEILGCSIPYVSYLLGLYKRRSSYRDPAAVEHFTAGLTLRRQAKLINDERANKTKIANAIRLLEDSGYNVIKKPSN